MSEPLKQFHFNEKKAFRDRAKLQGFWPGFVELKEELKAKGVTGIAAWHESTRHFGWIYHKNGKGHFREDSCSECDQALSEGSTKRVDQTQIAGNPPIGEKSPQAQEDEDRKNDLANRLAGAKTYAGHERMVKMSKSLAETLPKQSVTEDVEWAIEQLAMADVTPNDAPTARAWGLYSVAAASQRGMELLMAHHQRLMPNQAQMKAEGGFGILGQRKLNEFESFLESEEHTRLLAEDALQLKGAQVARG